MDIGTAKPVGGVRARYHLIDLVEPEEYSVAEFQEAGRVVLAALPPRIGGRSSSGGRGSTSGLWSIRCLFLPPIRGCGRGSRPDRSISWPSCWARS